MKKRILIICSIIGVLLAGFQFPIYAEETITDYSSSTSIMASTPLDQYFYDNYKLLPYIESSGDQYINLGINPSNNYRISLKFGDLKKVGNELNYIFGIYEQSTGTYGAYVQYNNNQDLILYLIRNSSSVSFSFDPYNIYTITFDRDKAYFNNELKINYFNDYSLSDPLYLFARNFNNQPTNYSSYKVYNLSIYDYAANDGEGALVRDYYPARSKSGGVIGLYDAVSKTFISTSGSVPFASPTGDSTNLSLGANITQFLSGSLSWIGAIFEGINEMPIIWVFIAIALAGVMFRWARRIINF